MNNQEQIAVSEGLNAGDTVVHPRFNVGTVEFDKGITVIVRFEHGLEECKKADLTRRRKLDEAIAALEWSTPVEVITRAQAAAILSVNDTWGVFSRSRINLLPHQLWVCHRVLRRWPARYLIADDVGLGKTIEAGLILWPLLSKGLTRRFLILCPAALVEQWQERLRDMFDIRLVRYLTDADRPKADFWNTHHQVVASLPTLRADHDGRHERLFEAEPWDLLIVDEAHHLNASENQGPTLGYGLVQRLLNQGKVNSCLFFTGTPHRGKPYNFWALLRLLRPDLFNPAKSDLEQFPYLHQVLIRNNKQSVTDMQGRKLFKPVRQHPQTYRYSPAEADFYQLLTDFIASGRAYASSLSPENRRQVILVLIAMQKLASSSVAAIRRALKGRLGRLIEARDKLVKELEQRKTEIQRRWPAEMLLEDADLLDLQQVLEETMVVDTATTIQLVENEIPHLRILVDAADAVGQETKIVKLMEVLADSFAGRQVLFFTEYKATQALLMSALIERYGEGCVTFINGDNRIDDVKMSDGRLKSISETRDIAAERFNAGKVRFLVSTEAGGEGIDLQEMCHTLIHVDLPWNPMRLHQRVGRLNRYGQRQAVDVVSLRNEDTVEALIWGKLNDKLEHIMRALGSAMDEPEDLLQLVLGMTEKSLFTGIFVDGAQVERERFSDWFDEKTKTFGGQSAIETVKALVGKAAKFDYQGLKDIPACDLPDLRRFFESMLALNKRRPVWEDDRLSFKTPEEWLDNSPGVRRRYEDMIFSRQMRGRDAAEHIVGVGHQAFDRALLQALNQTGMLAAVEGLEAPVVALQVYDRVTEVSGAVRTVTFGVKLHRPDKELQLLTDAKLLSILNGLNTRQQETRSEVNAQSIHEALALARDHLEGLLPSLNLPFDVPAVRPLAVLWPQALQKTLSQ